MKHLLKDLLSLLIDLICFSVNLCLLCYTKFHQQTYIFYDYYQENKNRKMVEIKMKIKYRNDFKLQKQIKQINHFN